MLVQVDDAVINTDQILFININDKNNSIKIFFSEEVYRSVSFPNYDDLNRFLGFMGREKIFA
ncbi:hypothetical protein E0H89_03615 [Acinetobacter sp. ANC 3781]|uniref:hypothetical protein n=1 Tax=Acinetobacter sp. ANC 3781 TaxID=2529835 RepID=UPI001040162B|nr:hypothetical protein [Acinetobacter sp. ANC 3781]TCB79352.1 hypothetical protein E0H89_03615 [Acinetobacter sp. ANC 3781]